ncbi:MAG: hypothetical protein AAFX78_05280, partial [Cyanobacteria bacterium J06638_20]
MLPEPHGFVDVALRRDRTLSPIAEDLTFVDMVFTAAGSLRVLSQYLYDTRLETWNVSTGERLE